MNKKDFLHGCHSGVQKAIRRSDIDLLKTTVSTMWAEKEHRDWLKWRTTILAEEECYQMLGELGQFYDTRPGDNESEWMKMLTMLALVDKSKDTESLYFLAGMNDLPEEYYEHPEMKELRNYLKVGLDDPSKIATAMYEDLVEAVPDLTEYERCAMLTMKSRAASDGMMADRFSCLAGMQLIARRRLPEYLISKHVEDAIARYDGRIPQMVNLPWDVFDMHTQVGRIASDVFMKNYSKKYPGMSKEIFENIWFFFESAWNKHDQLVAFDLDRKLTCFDSMRWPIMIEKWVAFGNCSAMEAKKLWNQEMKPQLQKIVLRELDKRSGQLDLP
jgi:hypothetical protein